MVSPPEAPITGVVIVADKGKCPMDFAPIDKAKDEPSAEADIWKDGFFAFSRVYRYIAVSRTPPKGAFVVNVLADLAIGNAGDPVPPGFVPLDTTEDSREKALRKKQLSVRMVPRASAVDAVSDIVCLTRQKKPPQGYTLAGEIDGVCVCFKYSVIPTDFPSTSQGGASAGGAMYPVVGAGGAVSGGLPYPIHPNANGGASQASHQPPQAKMEHILKAGVAELRLAQRQESAPSSGSHGIDGLPFKLHPSLEGRGRGSQDALPPLRPVDTRRLEDQFSYSFATEQQVLTSQLST